MDEKVKGELMNTEIRPDFTRDLSIQEFERHYWYKQELNDICRKYNISPTGTKAELEEKIKKLLHGDEIIDHRLSNTMIRKKQQLTELSLSTKLIPDGFKFNQKAREFFANYYNKPKFSFTKEMATALREAERHGNTEMTVTYLIKVYEDKNKFESKEESTYQWNKFVKDFNKDSKTKFIKQDRMKIAAQLWKQVRDNPGKKQYSSSLIEEYLNHPDEGSQANLGVT
ncbi:SAP domain protein [Paenibacillus sp. LMG 31458]|uniref:SAP domain protein n=2 Tax=Paenibacillus phytorum TaxID=2654977 RepID=A0ABX1Y3D3_9BACL|nr:SAP domain protein [Paenibacillus phytorum]